MTIRHLKVFTCIGSAFALQSILQNVLGTEKHNGYISADKEHGNDVEMKVAEVQLDWFPSKQTAVNDLDTVINGSGVFGFLFDGSNTPPDLPYTTYNWCNMPHVRRQEYVKAPEEYKLEYVEVIHRHHKRTPYASNMFLHERETWNCDDESLFYYGAPKYDGSAASINWDFYTSTANPLVPSFHGTCQFPQITAGGLLDSRQHGEDLRGVYRDLLGFLPDKLDPKKMKFRVTNNQITSQVAGQVLYGMYNMSNHAPVRVLVQPASVDSLEPSYVCPAATKLLAEYGVGSKNSVWQQHLRNNRTIDLFAHLDLVSGVDKGISEWHSWFDHYFDNLSSRLCHQKPLPCNAANASLCVTQEDADAVFRRGEYEYSLIYRDIPELFQSTVAAYGIWFAELAQSLRDAVNRKSGVIYRHNFAHDGSVSRILSFLQAEIMVWPGMGSEVVFELYSQKNAWFIRMLWGGQVFISSNPGLGKMDLIPVESLLAYIDGLVGVGGSKIPGLCQRVTDGVIDAQKLDK